MRPDRLNIVSRPYLGLRNGSCAYKGALDAVHEQNLQNHDDGRDRMEIEHIQHREPSFAKEIADFQAVSKAANRFSSDGTYKVRPEWDPRSRSPIPRPRRHQ
jgi:hypothetical protein